ncbi:MAG: hypothetical protein GY903_31250 [Fuerstiella sp.]|nr:hypothetical protein [Fuerstiella sp.]MCP4858970.1 hypothetical protein [Fuerstiella sp.]
MPVEVTDKSQVSRIWLTMLAAGCLLLTASPYATAAQTEGGSPAEPTAAQPADDNDPGKVARLAQQDLVNDLRHLQKSLLTPEIVSGFGSENRTYRGLLRTGINARNAKDLEVIRTCLKYRAYSLSDPDVQKNPALFEAAFRNMERELNGAGGLILNATDKQRFRELLCGELLPLFKELLQNNLLARSVALELLLDFDVAPARNNRGVVMFDQVDEVLLSVLTDPAQPNVIKTRAANVCKNYLQKADVTPQIQVELAKALITELARQFTEIAYQNYLLAALEEISIPRELVGKKRAIIMLAATATIQDTKRDILIRCRAARLLGRCGFDSAIDFDVLAWKVAELTLETGARYNQSKNKKDPKWRLCGWHLYLAFHHKNKRVLKGFLNRDPKSKPVRSAYEASLPIMLELMRQGGSVPAGALNTLNTWEGKNKPANLTFDPACPPLK